MSRIIRSIKERRWEALATGEVVERERERGNILWGFDRKRVVQKQTNKLHPLVKRHFAPYIYVNYS